MLLDLRSAAEQLGMKPQQLHKLALSGRVPAVNTGSRTRKFFRFDSHALHAWRNRSLAALEATTDVREPTRVPSPVDAHVAPPTIDNITATEAAKMLGRSNTHVRDLCRGGRLTRRRNSLGKWVYSRADVERYLAQRDGLPSAHTPAPTNGRLITKDVAKILDRSVSYVAKATRDGKLPGVRVGNHFEFTPEAVTRFQQRYLQYAQFPGNGDFARLEQQSSAPAPAADPAKLLVADEAQTRLMAIDGKLGRLETIADTITDKLAIFQQQLDALVKAWS